LEPSDNLELREPKNFEEVRLVLGLSFQRGRWDGSDGGQGGYGEVLARMADAKRYEDGTEDECSLRFIEDMHDRFEILADNTSMELREMRSLLDTASDDIDHAKRKCSGLVLEAMGFIDKGL
jgi:hypothetical protein